MTISTDDSLCKSVVILTTIANIDTVGYCNDLKTLSRWFTSNYATYNDGNTFRRKEHLLKQV